MLAPKVHSTRFAIAKSSITTLSTEKSVRNIDLEGTEASIKTKRLDIIFPLKNKQVRHRESPYKR